MSDTTTCTHVNYDDYFDKCEDCGYEPETCWNCSEPLKPGREIVVVGGIFCSEDCHEAFTSSPERTLTTRKDPEPMAESIEQLTIYKLARRLEDEVYELVKAFTADQFYGLGNDLRRSSAAVSHHIMGCHRLFSYRLKLDELAAMRREAEDVNEQINMAGDLLGADKVAE